MFVNVVGASVLSAWDAAVAGRAFALLHHHARRLLGLSAPGGSSLPEGETAGYAVKMTEGMCLCAFACPAAAMLWGARLVDGLRLSGEWEPALLAHELCEEVRVGVGGWASLCACVVGRLLADGLCDEVRMGAGEWACVCTCVGSCC